MATPQLKQQRSLIHGLPDHLVVDQILARAASWWDCRSIRAVSKGWRGAVEDPSCRSMFGAIHRADPDTHTTGLTLAVSVYDPQTSSWERLPPIPGVPCGAPLSARCICLGGKLYVIGGRVYPTLEFSDRVFSIDLRACKRRWVECRAMHRPRCAFACLAWGGRIVAAGGQGVGEMAMSAVEAFDPVTDTWIDLPELEIPRAECTGAVIENGILCVVGGYSIHPFDEEQTVWVESMDVLDTARAGAGWAAVESGSTTLGSCVIQSGVLGRLQGSSVIGRCLRKCGAGGQWATVEGRICSSSSSSSSSVDDLEEEDEALLLMAVGQGGEEYATRCVVDSSGRVRTSLWRASVDRFVNADRTVWEEVQLPFDLVPTVSCCSVLV